MATVMETIGQLAKDVESILGTSRTESSLLGNTLANLSGAGGRPTEGGAAPGLGAQFAGGAFGGGAGLIAGLFGSLFRREAAVPSFLTYERPDAIQFDYDLASMAQPSAHDRGGRSIGTSDSSAAVSSGAMSRNEIVIQVNAMDASSFVDRRDDIASAVREALVRNHSLRDEIWED